VSRPLALRADRVLAGGEERRGRWVVVRDGAIAEVARARPAGAREADLGAVDLLPGLVDLHSDCLEARARPRTPTVLSLEEALLELDAEVAAHGITTHFVCACLEENLTKFRSPDRAAETVEAVERLAPELRADHRVHLRVDVTGEGIAMAGELASRPVVGLVSYMLHLPGRGQFADEASWRAYYRTVEGEDDGAVRVRLERRRARLGRLAQAQKEVARLAREAGVALASHDDDSAAAAARAARLGAAIVEFPVAAEAAREAAGRGLRVVMGAPNARRGRSHHANLSAREALAGGWLAALASDYHPPSLLAAAYALEAERACSWSEAMALVSAGPAEAAGLSDRGRILEGLRADLVAVGRRAGRPAVAQVWRAGREVWR
jgi:alpha-D-ribose 1-methylphosphonate 5-triphosphate diphosphatase